MKVEREMGNNVKKGGGVRERQSKHNYDALRVNGYIKRLKDFYG